METCSLLIFYVNGHKVTDSNVDPSWTLLEYLRKKLLLCGTKMGCGEGGCGACTVMVSKYDHHNRRINHLSVNACLAPICSVHGLAVTTVEGIGSTQTKLHPVQERIFKSHGSQCGFCTPGIVMSMYALLRNNPQPTMEQLETYFQGNLCRCTGYRPILDAYRTFTKSPKACQNGGECCMNGFRKTGNSIAEDSEYELLESQFLPYDPSQEPIFPSELQLSNEYDKQFLVFESKTTTWYRPATLQALLELKNKHPEAKLAIGNTEIGIEVKFKNFSYPILIAPNAVPELNAFSMQKDGITFGAATTLSRMEEILQNVLLEEPEHKTRVFAAIVEMLQYFAGKQIRNVASLAGNIITASPISDLNPLLMAASAKLHLKSKYTDRTVILDDKFFVSYRNTSLKPNEILLSVTVPFTTQGECFFGYKQAQRREDDISIVNSGMRVLFQTPHSNRVCETTLAFGGMAPTIRLASKTMNFSRGKEWNENFLTEACGLLADEFPLDVSAPGGMVNYRKTLVLSFFFKFYHHVLNQLPHSLKIDITESSSLLECSERFIHGSQLFQCVNPEQMLKDPVGRPLPHHSAALQATGEAIYVDDIPTLQGELFLVLVMSTHAHARIVSLDPTRALALSGVRAFVSAGDLPEKRNRFGPPNRCEQVFARNEVTCQGQVLGAIAADDEATARAAAKLVSIEYEDIEPLILSIEDAIANNSFFHHLTRTLRQGNAEKALELSDHVIEGEFRVGGQEHFYMEPQSCLVIPRDQNEMEVISSTQNLTETQEGVAHALNLPLNRIVCKVKRIGGGFGGKESRSVPIAIATAVAAKKVGRPIRCILRRDEDMANTGNRHPFLSRYKVGFSKEGRINALRIEMYSNAGNTVDLSLAVLTRALVHLDNAYRIPEVFAQGFVCKTNLPSNTAFRGFGAPQAMLTTENFMDEVASFLRKDAAEIRELNMYQVTDKTYFNQSLEQCTIRRCWKECKMTSDFSRRKEKVQQFNRENRWKKRGIEMIPVKFGIAFNVKFMNQAGALVHIYLDGSVLVNHAGVEMGQGLHIKMMQVASRALGVSLDRVHISETSTDKVPNTSPSAASASSDLNGMAILKACETLLKRVEPYRKANSKGTWNEWVRAAYMDRVSLSATGFYKTPNLDYDFQENCGRLFNYYSYGVACSEVEIDCLTGSHQVLRTDIVMDVGDSLNPSIDIGQIEGAFVQGYGLFTVEEVKYSPKGYLYTRGPGTYKIPSFGDIPKRFNVSLLKNASNKHAVYSSKAIGEPPLFLASTVFFAIKKAVLAARLQHNLKGTFRFDSPATAEKIRLAIEDPLVQQVWSDQTTDAVPWAIVV